MLQNKVIAHSYTVVGNGKYNCPMSQNGTYAEVLDMYLNMNKHRTNWRRTKKVNAPDGKKKSKDN